MVGYVSIKLIMEMEMVKVMVELERLRGSGLVAVVME